MDCLTEMIYNNDGTEHRKKRIVKGSQIQSEMCLPRNYLYVVDISAESELSDKFIDKSIIFVN